MAATIPPLEGIRTNQRPQAGVQDGDNLRVFSPGHNLPAGNPGEKDSGGNLGVHQYLGGVFWRLSTVMYSKERKRFP